jgi:hypothetical protein
MKKALPFKNLSVRWTEYDPGAPGPNSNGNLNISCGTWISIGRPVADQMHVLLTE